MAKSRNKIKMKLLLFLLVILLFAVDYPFMDKFLKNQFSDYEIGIVERVIDGDTVEVNGSSVRLLGINSPEKGEKHYSEAKVFLENRTRGQLVKLIKGKEDKDLYGRKLRYIFLNEENVNLEIVKQGYGNFYFPSGKDKYYKDFKSAWESCVDTGKNLCEGSKSKCSSCVKLREFDVESQTLVLANKCGFRCDMVGWSIKDEGRKKFIFPGFALEKEVKIIVGNRSNSKDILFWKGEEYVWTKTGDTLFLRDNDDKLVLYWTY